MQASGQAGRHEGMRKGMQVGRKAGRYVLADRRACTPAGCKHARLRDASSQVLTGKQAGRGAGRQGCRQAGRQAGWQAGRQAGRQAGTCRPVACVGHHVAACIAMRAARARCLHEFTAEAEPPHCAALRCAMDGAARAGRCGRAAARACMAKLAPANAHWMTATVVCSRTATPSRATAAPSRDPAIAAPLAIASSRWCDRAAAGGVDVLESQAACAMQASSLSDSSTWPSALPHPRTHRGDPEADEPAPSPSRAPRLARFINVRPTARSPLPLHSALMLLLSKRGVFGPSAAAPRGAGAGSSAAGGAAAAPSAVQFVSMRSCGGGVARRGVAAAAQKNDRCARACVCVCLCAVGGVCVSALVCAAIEAG
eukprot:366510-Chlamydomonas_euryale.AAC.7